MKSLIATTVALFTLLAAGCNAPGANGPSLPQGVPANFIGIRFHFESHDASDFPNSVNFNMVLLAHAQNPALLGAFEEPDTGVTYPFRDPATRVDIPVILDKATPYGADIYFPPQEPISFIITYQFYGLYGDVLICEFQQLDGTPIMSSRSYAGVYDQSIRNMPGIQSSAGNVCTYTTGNS